MFALFFRKITKMKLRLLLSALLIPFLAQAQENVQVKGRIVDSRGEAVEYVQVGIPKYYIGTISTVDGHVILDAKAQLSSTLNTIQQITYNLNFPSQSFFGRYFKRSTGVSPSEYRASARRHGTNISGNKLP